MRDQAEKNTTTYCCKLELELGLELEVSLVPALRELKGTMQQTVGSLSLSLSSWKVLRACRVIHTARKTRLCCSSNELIWIASLSRRWSSPYWAWVVAALPAGALMGLLLESSQELDIVHSLNVSKGNYSIIDAGSASCRRVRRRSAVSYEWERSRSCRWNAAGACGGGVQAIQEGWRPHCGVAAWCESRKMNHHAVAGSAAETRRQIVSWSWCKVRVAYIDVAGI